jgi:hypothetical protein
VAPDSPPALAPDSIPGSSGAVIDIPDDLLEVIKCWSKLSSATRRAIVMIATAPT